MKWSAVYDTLDNCSIDVEAIENNLRFAGQYYDAETGLHYNWNRYYDPETGRYMRVDPVGEGLNLYLYVQNNPLKYIDPRGLSTGRVQNNPGNQQSVTGQVVVEGDYFTDADGNKQFLAVNHNSNANLSLTSRNREVPGLTSAPTYNDVGRGVSNSSGLANKIVREAVSFIPVVGPGIDAYNSFKEEDYVRGGLYAGLAVAEAVPGLVALSKGAKFAPKIISSVAKFLKGSKTKTFDQARREAFEKAGITDPSKVKITKYDPNTGTAVEFKGEGGAKVGYDGPHTSPGPHHDIQHISWQSAGKRGQGAQRDNIPYTGPRHPSRSGR